MLRTLFLFLFLFISNSILGQITTRNTSTQQVIGGIINDYTPVLALNTCNNKLTVENASAYNAGDTVLLIQMKGAIIDSTNTAAFGTITDYKNAGNYEFNYVKSKAGNVIELKNVLTRQYDIPAGKVQLVRVPYYQSADITSTLSCMPWDGSKGGVLVLNVQNDINLQADIDVSGKGFSGGQPLFKTNVHCNKTDYFYPPTNNEGGQKGEGIADISLSKRYGRGPLANGGGGGNSHNAGGAGGGNAGKGGTGGNQYPLALCPTIIPVIGGIGGNLLPYSNTSNKIFLGGGGGAGHANDLTDKPGGAGGGIIIIIANNIIANTRSIKTNGGNVIECTGQTTDCANDGHSGGGAGGSVILSVNLYNDNINIAAKGGKGADAWILPGSIFTTGPGGGGAGGVIWFNQSAVPAFTTNSISGGPNGVARQYSNDPWGSTSGQDGTTQFNLQIPVDNIPFKANIDSVRIQSSNTGCSSFFNFNGLGYTNTNPVSTWQWYFGDNAIANTQNTNHTYSTAGSYIVKLVITDMNGCMDSITKTVTVGNPLNFDFNYQRNVCNPLSVQFTGLGPTYQNPYWSFGDASTITGTTSPVHIYSSPGTYTIKYSLDNGACRDTVIKTIDLSIIQDDIISTHDTTICFGTTKKLLTQSSLSYCWTPSAYLDNANSPTPITSTPQNITYYYTAEVTGANIIVNGNFNAGNTGFTSAYNYANPNITEAQYFVGTSPQAWNPSLSNCSDHTGGNGNMMLINGAPTPNVEVWRQTVNVIPNTNYAFSTWVQALYPPNPAQLRFSINGQDVGALITASLPTCTWTQFYTTWNSGNNTTAAISIVNKNTAIQGNDFALDDISFAPVFFKRDSVNITVEKPSVVTNDDLNGCKGTTYQLNTTGASVYNWTPSAGLNNPAIANPVASPAVNTQYIVTGTTINGCTAKDTVNITVYPVPVITKSNDTTICKNSSLQLTATGGTTYSWTPAGTLNNTAVANPVATPTTNTMYYVTVTNANNCSNNDSVKVSIRPDPVFAVNPSANVCENNTIQLAASGGEIYSWQPAGSLDNSTIANPNASPVVTTTYTVVINDIVCNNSASLSTTITVLDLPIVKAGKSNDIDCSIDQSQLTASGAIKYNWSPAATLNNTTIINPIAKPDTTTRYKVKGTDQFGCINYDSVVVNVTITNKGGYLMPTGFTPNNDGLNDCYGIKYWGIIQGLDFSIYNRWGERVFHTTQPGSCWDGKYKGKEQDPGVFVYVIKAATSCEKAVFRKGTFALIR